MNKVRETIAAIFFVMSVFGACILGSVSDIQDGYMMNYIILWLIEGLMILTSVMIYNHNIILRHMFAMYGMISILHGYIHKIRTSKYRFLYRMVVDSGSMAGFYSSMLELYDSYHVNNDNEVI